jgi:hypothetical protein
VVSATISSGSRAVFVPIAPCRLVDTRPTTPLTAKRTVTYQVHGTNGACTIPPGATAISGNATITDPTDDGFLTIAPSGGVGTSSNLNWLRSQSPTPNAFTVALSANGRIDVFNDRGTVNLIIDVNGYYEDHHHDDRYYTKALTDAALAAKANSDDVYTKAEVDASGMNALRAAGQVAALDGSSDILFATIGTFTTSKAGTGAYAIVVPGAAPGCGPVTPWILVTLSGGSGPGEIAADWSTIICQSGDTTFLVRTYTSAGVAVDRTFTFAIYAKPAGGLLVPQADGTVPTRCDNNPDGVICE